MAKYAPYGFRYVTPTPEEVEANPRVARRNYRLECLTCGRRIWGSGMGVGSHRRACRRKGGDA